MDQGLFLQSSVLRVPKRCVLAFNLGVIIIRRNGVVQNKSTCQLDDFRDNDSN